jgi:hypothetical protein
MESEGSFPGLQQPAVSILSQMNPVHNFPIYFLNIDSNVILSSTSRSYKWSFS